MWNLTCARISSCIDCGKAANTAISTSAFTDGWGEKKNLDEATIIEISINLLALTKKIRMLQQQTKMKYCLIPPQWLYCYTLGNVWVLIKKQKVSKQK